jgi:hypothetical protein
MTKDYCWSWFTAHRNEAFMNRLLSDDYASMSPADQWSWWTWQRYRFEQRLLAQAQWVLRNQEAQRQQHRIEQGFPAPELEMKTKRFTLDTDTEESGVQQKEQADDDSDHQPNCSICLIPLENGDRIGALDCKHNFHSDCLKAWLSRRNVCPLCSQPVARRRPQPNEEDYLNENPSTITPHRRFPWQRTATTREQQSLSSTSISTIRMDSR